MTREYFRVTGQNLGGELGDAMIRFADNPGDTAAADRLAEEPSYVGTTRTTCVVTMLQAGHAENALPQSAIATVNCRIFPGVAVADIEETLQRIVGNPAARWTLLTDAVESPISELREDVAAAVSEAVHGRYPGAVGVLRGSGRSLLAVGVRAVSGAFMNPDDMYAHGLNERVPIKTFYDALDHWSIILRELAGD